MNALKEVKMFTQNFNTIYSYAYKVTITLNYNDCTL